MTPDQLAAMAREAMDVTTDARGRVTFECDEHGLARFAALVLEEAAKVCEELRLICPSVKMQRDQTAAAIRALAR